MINKKLIAFGKLISTLNTSDNLVLGGTSALELQGIELGRTSEDIYIIIYNPTKEQDMLIDALSIFDRIPRSGGFECYETTVMKFKKGEYYMDLHIVSDEDTPKTLYDKTAIGLFRIQTVANVIKAKAAYGRDKDKEDLGNMKLLNFNTKAYKF